MPRGVRRRTERSSAANPAASRRTAETVTIKNVNDLHAKNQEANLTDEFESPNHIVLRRGNTFEFLVSVSSLANVKEESLTIELGRGYRPRHSRGTKFQGACSVKSKRHFQWDLEVVNKGSDSIHYRLSIPADAPVGSYRVHVRLPAVKGYDSVWELSKEIVILFNPWCKEDEVYLADDKKRNEYVLNESGLIWAGTHQRTFTWPWNFAQFETVSLEAVLYMMDKWRLGSDARKSPIEVSRCMAEMVNSNDSDGGILVGLWSSNDKDYADGTDPTSWSGSEAILREYMKTKKPVKYAQCWVFGGTLTTTLRTLGIPSRPITNFESAHDADFNRAIDYYFDENDRMIDDMSSDSIWNYHVWCEGWMTRPDLEGHHGGWQALDATPQELSPHTRTMVVGPASTQAIKDGMDLKFDNEFVIGEVNADIKYHCRSSKDGEFSVMGSNTSKVGKHISTKAVGRDAREDITDQYKYPEGSPEERAALQGKASGSSARGDGGSTQPFEFSADLVSTSEIGSDLTFEVSVGCKSSTEADVRVTAVIEQTTYTGIVGKEIKKLTKRYKGKLGPGSAQKLRFPVEAREYVDELGEQGTFMATFLAYVENHKTSWISRLPINLSVPNLTINVDKKGSNNVSLKALKTVEVTASFKNPLKKPLTNVKYFIEGTGLLTSTSISSGVIAAKGTSTVKFRVTPRSYSSNPTRNNVTLIVTAKSHQVKGIMGTATIKIVQ